MDYDDVKKQATPGPLVVLGAVSAFSGITYVAPKSHTHLTVATCRAVSDMGEPSEARYRERVANARLIAHHWSNFDDVVKALERVMQEGLEEPADTGIGTLWVPSKACLEAREVLARAKEVKT